jgi:hypothetical protein
MILSVVVPKESTSDLFVYHFICFYHLMARNVTFFGGWFESLAVASFGTTPWDNGAGVGAGGAGIFGSVSSACCLRETAPPLTIARMEPLRLRVRLAQLLLFPVLKRHAERQAERCQSLPISSKMISRSVFRCSTVALLSPSDPCSRLNHQDQLRLRHKDWLSWIAKKT